MRVVAGKYKRRLLEWPDDNSIRPTKDRIREAMFSAFGDLTNQVVVDLYSGSGALGIEALSHNAKKCYFVDHGITAIKTTKKNIKSLNIPESDYEIFSMEDSDALNIFKKDKIKFDLVLLDPPYKEGKYQELVATFINDDLLNHYAIIMVECDKKQDFNYLENFKVKEYKYGDIFVYILRSSY